MRRASSKVAWATLLAAVLLGGQAHASSGPERSGSAPLRDAVAALVDEPVAQTLSHWTSRRMRAARTRSGSGAPGAERRNLLAGGHRFDSGRVGTPGVRHLRAHGRVFFSIPGEGDFACSGTVVRSPSRSVVMTAGHCAFDDRRGRPVTRLIFVPAYEDGRAPFGRFVARRIVVPSGWAQRGDSRFDLAFARMRPDGDGRRVQQAVGARSIRFGSRGEPVQAFGYPARDALLPILPSLRFDGQKPWSCRSPYAGDDTNHPPPQPLSIACDMGGGASGGGWVNSRGRIVSVTAYGYLLLSPNRVFGPFLGTEARQAYRALRGKRPKRAR